MSLRQRTFSAVRWTTAGTIIKTLLQLAQVSVLARLLAPEDYGLMAMVMVVLGFASHFSDFGINSAFVQRREVTEDQRSSLFWFNVLVSLGLTLLVVILSPLFAIFFNDERLTLLIMLTATTFVIGALGIQVRMAAEKALRFQRVMIVEVIATVAGFTAALITAYADWGVYALLTGGITNAVTSTLLAWLFLAEGWFPAWKFRFADVRSFLGFGGALVANNLVNQFNATIDILVGGRMLLASQLGFYSVPRELSMRVQSIVNPVITRVAFPLIAEIQHNTDRVRSIYLQTLNMTASTNAPVYIGIAFFAPDIVSVLLGSGWEASASILQILAIWGGLRSLGNPAGSLLLGMGRADLALKWNLALLMIVPPAVWFGSGFGSAGIAWSLLILSASLFIPGWFVLIRPLCHARLSEYTLAALRPFAIALISTAPAYLIASITETATLRIAIGSVLVIPLYLGLSYLINKQWINSIYELLGRNRETTGENL